MTAQHADDAILVEIAEKIAKLEAMTVDNGATPAEAESAAAMIQKLLTKYNLSQEAARKLGSGSKKTQASDIVIETSLNFGERRFEWEEVLSHNIARGFYCKVLYFRLGYYFIGTSHDTRIAIQTFNRLRPLIAAMATRATETYADEWRSKGVMDVRQLRGPYSLKTFKLNYLNGVVAGIGQKLAEQRRASDLEAAGEVTALVVVRDVAIDAKVKDRWPKLLKGRASDSQRNDEAYSLGRKDGYDINLHRGELTDKGQ